MFAYRGQKRYQAKINRYITEDKDLNTIKVRTGGKKRVRAVSIIKKQQHEMERQLAIDMPNSSIVFGRALRSNQGRTQDSLWLPGFGRSFDIRCTRANYSEVMRHVTIMLNDEVSSIIEQYAANSARLFAEGEKVVGCFVNFKTTEMDTFKKVKMWDKEGMPYYELDTTQPTKAYAISVGTNYRALGEGDWLNRMMKELHTLIEHGFSKVNDYEDLAVTLVNIVVIVVSRTKASQLERLRWRNDSR